MSEAPSTVVCQCAARPAWARLEDDTVLHWSVAESGDWEELRECPDCGSLWICAWPEELESNPILCRPLPASTRRLRDVDRIETLRPYCLARLEEHLGPLKDEKRPCKKLGCEFRRIRDTAYCLEHHIAQRFGRQLSRLDRKDPSDL
ncbi:MAG TPA: hypothetical protein VGF45_10880 [Polyangia bacterium]